MTVMTSECVAGCRVEESTGRAFGPVVLDRAA